MATFFRACFSYCLGLAGLAAALPAAAQSPRSLHLGLQAGPGLSFNHTKTARPLPGQISTYAALAPVLNAVLTYRFNERYALEAAAGWYVTHDGLSNKLAASYDAQGAPLRGSSRYGSYFPVRQVRVHGLRRFPLGRGVLAPFVGLGASFVWGRFREYAGFGNYYEQVNPQGQSVYVYMQSSVPHSWGVLVGAQAGLDLRLSPRSTVQLSAQYHQGLRTIYESRTTEFIYSNAYTGPATERYQARFLNRGSYGVVALSYQRRLGGGR